MAPRRLLWLGLLGLLALNGASHAEDAPGTVHDLTIGGMAQRLFYMAPAAPKAILVMLPGGDGIVGIDKGGQMKHGGNFLVRSRGLWVAHGYGVLIADATGDQDLRGQRSTSTFADILREIVTYAHTLGGKPIFLIGTSQGSIAAMNGAAHMGPGDIAGLVLTESVSRISDSGETVFDAHPNAVVVPALVVVNRADACPAAPPDDGQRIVASLDHAKSVDMLTVSGGIAKGNRCGPFSPHGYFGIEDDAVGAIATWLDSHLH
jgi:hypothetical protein